MDLANGGLFAPLYPFNLQHTMTAVFDHKMPGFNSMLLFACMFIRQMIHVLANIVKLTHGGLYTYTPIHQHIRVRV